MFAQADDTQLFCTIVGPWITNGAGDWAHAPAAAQRSKTMRHIRKRENWPREELLVQDEDESALPEFADFILIVLLDIFGNHLGIQFPHLHTRHAGRRMISRLPRGSESCGSARFLKP